MNNKKNSGSPLVPDGLVFKKWYVFRKHIKETIQKQPLIKVSTSWN